MPEIDNDLFQVLVPALLLLAALLLFALLASLSGIRKVLKQQLTETQDLRNALAPGGAGTPADLSQPDYAEPTPTETSVGDEPQPEAQEDSLPFVPEPGPLLGGAAATSAADDGGPEDPFAVPAQPDADDPLVASAQQDADDPFAATTSEDDDAFSSTHADDPFAAVSASPEDDAPDPAASEPFAAATTTPAEEENPFVTEADQPAAQSTLDEPEEQPFERNGRWFFRRDDELLVYEEGTGEWVPADPADAQPAPAPPPASSSEYPSGATAIDSDDDFGSSGPDDTARLDAVEDPRPTAGGGFWKCPSCGAVNGSSASTCRMCFSERP